MHALLFPESTRLGTIVGNYDDHRAAANFAIVVELRRLFVVAWQRNAEALKTGGAGDVAEVHARKFRRIFGGIIRNFLIVRKYPNTCEQPYINLEHLRSPAMRRESSDIQYAVLRMLFFAWNTDGETEEPDPDTVIHTVKVMS